MATSLLSPPLTAPNPEARWLPISGSLNRLSSPAPALLAEEALSSKIHGQRYKPPFAKSLDHIPMQFRQDNLKDGLMGNFKNVPQSLYGLSPSQMDMFMTEDNPVRRQSESVTEEGISSARNYLDNGGMWSMSGIKDRGPSKYSMSVSMYRGGARGSGRPRTSPPDLPSLLGYTILACQ
ncbi:hypothetical protein REPUB_Repub04eG0083200 [Reevesia pubescens]